MLMLRGELYLGVAPEPDPRRQRVYLLVSRQALMDSKYSSVVCIPVYSTRSGAPTEVHIGPEQGLKVASALRCDEMTSVQKRDLKRLIARLSTDKMREVNRAMAIALAIDPEDVAEDGE
jgi:mRNA interferase MazF